MASSGVAVEAIVSVGIADGATNTHVRKQIQKLRLLKGWTQSELEQAAGMTVDSVWSLEAGVRRINLDALRRMLDALDADITDVWPSIRRPGNGQAHLLQRRAGDSVNFTRLAEVHSLTGAEASCMFTSKSHPHHALLAGEEPPESDLQLLATINLDEEERWRLSRQVLLGNVTAPWAVYFHRESGRSLYLCLKNACVETWVQNIIHRCLSAWLTPHPR